MFTHALRQGSHLGQNLDKIVLITIKSVKFLSSVDHAKCDLLVSTRPSTCPRRQVFKGAVVLPRSTTFCGQQTKNVFLVINLSVNSVNLSFLRLTFHLMMRPSYRSRLITNPRFRNIFPGFWDSLFRSNNEPKLNCKTAIGQGRCS